MMALLPPDPLFCLKSDMGHVHSICFVGDSQHTTTLLAATENGMVYFWDLETNRVTSKEKFGESIQSIHSTSNKIITQEKEGLVKFWELTENRYVLTETIECAWGYCKVLLHNESLILPQDNYLTNFDVASMATTKTFRTNKENLGKIMCIQKVPIDNQMNLLAGFESGDIILWDFLKEATVSHIKLREYITSITFDPVNCRGICGNASNILQIFTIDKCFNIALKSEISITNAGCNVVKLRDDRKIFACGGWDGRLRVFSWKSLRLLVVLNEHKGGVTDVQFSPATVKLWGRKVIAAAGADGVISLWSLYN